VTGRRLCVHAGRSRSGPSNRSSPPSDTAVKRPLRPVRGTFTTDKHRARRLLPLPPWPGTGQAPRNLYNARGNHLDPQKTLTASDQRGAHNPNFSASPRRCPLRTQHAAASGPKTPPRSALNQCRWAYVTKRGPVFVDRTNRTPGQRPVSRRSVTVHAVGSAVRRRNTALVGCA